MRAPRQSRAGSIFRWIPPKCVLIFLPSPAHRPCRIRQSSASIGPSEFGLEARCLQPARPWLSRRCHSAPDDLTKDDWRRNHPRFQAENTDANRHLIEAVTEIAAQRRCTPAQLALGWLLQQGTDIVPIPGTRRVSRLDENAAAVTMKWTSEDLQRINRVLAEHTVAGMRYPPAGMAIVNA